jgi:hypothetical protein
MVVSRDEMDRLILMRLDVDKYENQTIPNLQRQAALLRRALLEYGCHKASCGMTQQPETDCTCGLEAAMLDSRLQREEVTQ